jgi:hypothetical protein
MHALLLVRCLTTFGSMLDAAKSFMVGFHARLLPAGRTRRTGGRAFGRVKRGLTAPAAGELVSGRASRDSRLNGRLTTLLRYELQRRRLPDRLNGAGDLITHMRDQRG